MTLLNSRLVLRQIKQKQMPVPQQIRNYKIILIMKQLPVRKMLATFRKILLTL